MKLGLLGGLLAALLAVLGPGDWNDDDDPTPPPTVCAPADTECGVSRPPPPTVCPEKPCGVHRPPPARRS